MSVAPGASSTSDPEVKLLIPAGDVADPEVSIVVPAANERLTIVEFISWCKEGLEKAGVKGEILIVDSSTDDTAELAVAAGARVLCTPKRGLGRAYIDALPQIRGRYVLMGDCDCTYDFRDLRPFVERFRAGDEFIMGSRFRGTIEPGSMPPLHRYMGTPVTTWILNVIFSSRFSDIHCGMRGITRDALARMGLRSDGWEYASEMVLKSVHMGLRTSEVPIHFLRDREGRVSHHRRAGWLSPWSAAWTNLRAMFVHGADFFLLKPGVVLLIAGLVLALPLSFGPLTVGPVTFSLFWMMLGVTLAVVGLQSVYMGILAQTFYDHGGDITARWLRRFPYSRTVALAGALFVTGMAAAAELVVRYVHQGLRLVDESTINYMAVTGLLLMIFGFMTFTFTLLLHARVQVVRR